jgi:hypothetical protein
VSRVIQYSVMIVLFLVQIRFCAAEVDSPEDARRPMKMTLRVYNYAKLPRWTLDRTAKETAQIFGELGIDVVWSECPTTDREIDQFQGCLNRLEPADVVLKIIPRFQSKREGFRDTLFGFAAGSQITIVYNRVEEVAKGVEASRPQILAVSIAHEIGHVLLGPGSHSPTGIMRSQWNEEEFRRCTRQTFCFTPEQAERLKAELLIRVREEGDRNRTVSVDNMQSAHLLGQAQ